VEGRAASLRGFAGWLARHHPEVDTLAQLRRTHLEAFLVFDAARVCTGRVRHGQPISVRHHHRTVDDLRLFFDDLAAWGWANRPPGLLVHRSDVPRLPAPLPRALAPDVDAALMAAVAALDDPAARAGVTLLRGARVASGRAARAGTGLPMGPARTRHLAEGAAGQAEPERVIPLDEPTLDALDAWMRVRGRQRALPHPRDGRPTDFLLAIGGQRVGASRIRRGLDQAIAAARLTDRAGAPLHVTRTSCATPTPPA